MRKATKGLTLIELLVVISIISLISSIAFASLNSARGRAADAATKDNLHSVRTQAAIYYELHDGRYGIDQISGNPQNPGLCSSFNLLPSMFGFANLDPDFLPDPIIVSAITQSSNFSSNGYSQANCAYSNQVQSFAVSVPLKTNPTKYLCVDTDEIKEVVPAGVCGSGGDCGFSNFACK